MWNVKSSSLISVHFSVRWRVRERVQMENGETCEFTVGIVGKSDIVNALCVSFLEKCLHSCDCLN